jgi:hypothetical protein
MKIMKFSGRELAVIRALDYTSGTLGAEILVKTRINPEDALDILNGLLDAGYIETNPAQFTHVSTAEFSDTIFEVNPAYAHELKKTLVR